MARNGPSFFCFVSISPEATCWVDWLEKEDLGQQLLYEEEEVGKNLKLSFLSHTVLSSATPERQTEQIYHFYEKCRNNTVKFLRSWNHLSYRPLLLSKQIQTLKPDTALQHCLLEVCRTRMWKWNTIFIWTSLCWPQMFCCLFNGWKK